jgi:hypothetical protein
VLHAFKNDPSINTIFLSKVSGVVAGGGVSICCDHTL